MTKPGINDGSRRPGAFMCGVLLPMLLALGVSGTARAQRAGGGGGHFAGGGRGGGFSASSGGAFRGGGSASMGRGTGGFAAPAQVNGRGFSYAGRPGYGGGAQFRAPGGPGYGARANVGARPAFYNRGFAGTPSDRYRGQGYGNRFRYGYPGLYGSNLFYNPFFFNPFFGFGDPFYDDADGSWNVGYGSFPDSGTGYGNGPGYGSGAGYGDGAVAQGAPYSADGGQPYPNEPVPAYGPESEPGPWAQTGGGQGSFAPMQQEDPVTILFKDGRPPEHVRNYALTRSALLVTDAHMREIPLDQIDLPATQRVNHAAGVDFRVPQSF